MKTELFNVDEKYEIKTNTDVDKFFSYACKGKYEDSNFFILKKLK